MVLVRVYHGGCSIGRGKRRRRRRRARGRKNATDKTSNEIKYRERESKIEKRRRGLWAGRRRTRPKDHH